MEHTSPSFEAYTEALKKATQLQARLEQISDPHAIDLINRGLASLDSRIEELGQDPTLHADMQRYAESSNQSLEAINDLRGILPDEELDVEVLHHSNTISFVSAFMIRHGLGGVEFTPLETSIRSAAFAAPSYLQAESAESTLETTQNDQYVDTPQDRQQDTSTIPFDEVEADTNASFEGEETIEVPEKRPISLQVLVGANTVLKIGNKGKLIPLSSRRHEKQRDYTKERLAVLKILSESDVPVSAQDIVEKLSLDVKGEDEGVMSQVRSWLKNVTYRREPLFYHNGKIGPASTYRKNEGFDFTFEVITLEEEPQQTVPTEFQAEPSIIPLYAPDIVVERVKESEIPLRDFALLAAFFQNHEDLLQALQIPMLKPELAEMMLSSSSEHDQYHKIDRTSMSAEEIEEERRSAFERLRAILSDEESYEKLLLNTLEESEAYPFVEYLFDLEDEETRDAIIQILGSSTQILDSTRTRTYLNDGDRKHGDNYAGYREEIILPNGRVFIKTHTPDGKSTIEEYKPEHHEFNLDPIEVIQAESAMIHPAYIEKPLSQLETVEEMVLADEATLGASGIKKVVLERSETTRKVEKPDGTIQTTHEFKETVELKPEKVSDRKRVNQAFQARLDAAKSAIIDRNAPLQGTATHLGHYYKWINPKTVREGFESGILSRQEKGEAYLTLEDILRLGMWVADQNVYKLFEKTLVQKRIDAVAQAMREHRNQPR